MIKFIRRPGAFAGVMALTATLLAVPAFAQNVAPPVRAGAPNASSPKAVAQPPMPKKRAVHRSYGIEARIKNMHNRLHITAAQAPEWDVFARAMRENAEHMRKLIDERSSKLRTMNAVENLRTYANIAQAHADDIKRLVPAFDKLYLSMSEAQKKNADAVFRGIAERYHARHPASKPATAAAPVQK